MIVFLGPPGSGKGTQSNLFYQKDGIKAFSIGDLLRKEVQSNSPLSNLIAEKINFGNLVETEIIMQILFKNLNDELFILDGFPRNLEQAYEFDKLFSNKNCVFFDFTIDITLLINRLNSRVICVKCSGPNNKSSLICKFCNADSKFFYQREDDNLDAIQNRMNIYVKEHEKILKHYENNQNYIKINANDEPNNIYNIIRTCLINRNLL